MKSPARNEHVRNLARRVPGLSRAYWSTRRRLVIRRGHAPLDYAGAPLRIRATTREIVEKRLHPRAKEPWTVDWLVQSIRPGDVVYDIGANVGAYSLIAATLAGGDVSVVAFEPAYANYEALCENVVLNRVADRVIPLPIVLAERTRLASLESAETVAGATHSLTDGAGPAYRQPVLAYALDDLIGTFGLPAPSLVKLDVDGAEVLVLDGARSTIAAPSLRSVLVEIDKTQSDAVQERLRAAGLTLTSRYDEREGQPLPDIWYGVFERAGG